MSTNSTEKIKNFIVKNAQWLIFGLAIVVYLPSLQFGYVYDDELLILDNKHTMSGFSGLSDIWSSNMSNGVEGHNDGLFRPLPHSVFAFQIELFGEDPFYGHFFNILIYGILCWLIFKLLNELNGKKPFTNFLLTLLFALHPLHTEVVANIKSLDELLSLLLPLLGIYLVVKNNWKMPQNHLVLGVFIFLGLLSKESTIAWVIITPLLLFVIQKQNWKHTKIQLGVLTLVALVWLGWHNSVIQSMDRIVDEGLFSEASNSSLIPKEWYNQKATGVWITFYYLRQLFLPIQLVADYSPESILTQTITSWQFILSSLVFLTLLFVSFRFKKSMPFVALAIFSWFVFIAPVSNIFMHIGVTYAERLSFTPSFSLVLLGLGLSKLPKFNSSPKPLLLLSAGMLTLFSFKTIERIPDWKSNITLFKSDVLKFPRNYKLHYNYATHLVKEIKGANVETGKDKEINDLAIKHYKKSLAINSGHIDGLNNLGNAYRRAKDYGNAVKTYNEIIKNNPAYQKAYYNRGITYFVWKKYDLAREDLLHYAKRKQNLQLASAYYYAGVSSGYLNDFNGAIQHLKESVKYNANSWEAYNFLGMAYGNLGSWEDAIKNFQKAFKLNNSNEIKSNLSHAQSQILK